MMRFERIIPVIDTHAEGDPCRVVIGGFPYIPGGTMIEKRDYFRKHWDYVRTCLTQEPRQCELASIITTPANEEADVGLFFVYTGGYVNACGTATMSTVGVLIETGMISAEEPVTTVILDTPNGLVSARAEVQDGQVKGVSFQNVPSFYYKSTSIDLPDFGSLTVDIAFGGNWFALVNAEDLGIEVSMENAKSLAKQGWLILDAVNSQVQVQHPTLGGLNHIDIVQIRGKPTRPEAWFKNATTAATLGDLSRAPCGTGTCATMAMLYAKGELELEQEFIYEGLLGTIFRGKLIEETTVGDFKAVVPEVTGRAYITGINSVVIDPEDPLKYGFLLSI